jgi:hypothetical protein
LGGNPHPALLVPGTTINCHWWARDALTLARALQTLLFGVGPADPLTLALAALAFVLVAVLACCLPAARAARIDPVEALKSE